MPTNIIIVFDSYFNLTINLTPSIFDHLVMAYFFGPPCICENNKIVIVIITCSKLMFLQRFKYTDHYYIANIWVLS